MRCDHIMRTVKSCRHRIISALFTVVIVVCLSGTGVVWQYENNSTSDSESNQPFHLPIGIVSNAPIGTAPSDSSSMRTNSNLWSWGGAPRGFTVANETLNYPSDYYTSRFNMGYGNIGSPYGQNNLQNLSRYSTGFATGYATDYPGYNLNSILSSNEKSSYDPWNNYPGYDPNYPYGYGSS